MIFYVYLDPEVVSLANQDGPYALQSLLGMLRSFLQNCFIADFEDYRVQEYLRDQVDTLPDSFDRKEIKSLLGALAKRDRFIYCLAPDYTGEKNELDCVVEQAAVALLDLLLLGQELDGGYTIPDGVEVATLATYQHTDFERNRSRIAAEGRTFNEGELDEQEFLNQIFKKALRFATRIEICDKMFGKKYMGNYEHTAGTLLRWLETVLADPGVLDKLVFHCGVPDDSARDIGRMKSEIAVFKQGRLSRLRIELQFYDLPGSEVSLPHDRFIITNQIAIGIPRGMDFLNVKTRRNRDVTLDYKSGRQIDELLKNYSAGKLELIEL